MNRKRTMISLIGNRLFVPGLALPSGRRRQPKGMTFLEVLLTASILSLGFVGVYRIYFSIFDAYHHLSCRLQAFNVMNDHLSQLQRYLQDSGQLPLGGESQSRTVTIDRQEVVFSTQSHWENVDDLPKIFRVTIELNWRERLGPKQLTRTLFLSA